MNQDQYFLLSHKKSQRLMKNIYIYTMLYILYSIYYIIYTI